MRSGVLSVAVVASVVVACGARSPLGAPEISGNGGSSGGSGAQDAGGGAIAPADRCPSAVLAGAPKPLPRYCSTRDGRTRAAAPRAPHLTWTARIPITDGTTRFGATSMTTDASGHAFVSSYGGDGGDPSLRRVDAARGAIDWTAPVSGSPAPLLLSTARIEIADGDPLALTSIDPASGVESAVATLGFDDRAPDSTALGSDGSLYFVYGINVGTAHPSTVVSRVTPDGAVAWTSVDLATLGPVPIHEGDVFPSAIALGLDDTVILGSEVLRNAETTEVVIALSPDTGDVRWTLPLSGDLRGGPLVGPDGSIALAHGSARGAEIVFIDPTGHVRRTIDVPGETPAVFGLPAIARDGTLLAYSDAGEGVDGLVAFAPSGAVAWRRALSHVLDATITSDGSILVHDSFDVTLLDLATGKTKWVLLPPNPKVCINEVELTSAGGLVGLQCDGTLFGAAD